MAVAPCSLTVLRQGEMITMDLMDVQPLVPRCQVHVAEGMLTDLAAEWTRITTVATTQTALGLPGTAGQHDLQQLGMLLFAHLFPAAMQQRLRTTTATHLFLRLDDRLVHLPWEVAFDGEAFLLAKWPIGRQVITDYRPRAERPALPKDPSSRLRMLLIADPTGNLPSAVREVDEICALLDTCAQFDVTVMGGTHLRKVDLLRALHEHDFVHYAGHAYFDTAHPTRSGWVLDDTVVTAFELSQVAQPPLLVFANACQAGTTAPWPIDAAEQACGLGSAFLLAGVHNYIGTCCPIHDAHSAAFAADFYRHLLQGGQIGEALASARAIARHEAETRGLLWASYVHYGNPTLYLPLESSPAHRAPPTGDPQVVGKATPVPVTPAMSSREGMAPPARVLPPAGAERRHLTVLCCDLGNSIALAGQLDPEDYREVVQAYQAVCAHVIARFDGALAQDRGEGLLVYFGYPQAHDDDALRAVRAGLGIIAALGQRTRGLGEAQAVPLDVRLGIHTGLVVVGDTDAGTRQAPLALGETPNLVVRLSALAAPNTLLISAATRQLCGGFFTYQALGPQHLPGRAQPLDVYQVLAETTARNRLDATRSAGLTPLVGRAQEVALLRERWTQVQEGLGQVVLLGGEAGIGKSRLVEELQAHVAAASPAWLLPCQCAPYHQHSAWYPLMELLERVVLRFDQEASPPHKLRTLEAYVEHYGPPLAETVPLLAALLSIPLTTAYPPLSITPEQQKQKTFQVLLQLFLRIAAQQPVLFVMEDVHWADPTTVEWLSLLVDQGPTAPILALWTFRPDFSPPWTGRAHLTQMTLSRLPRRQTGEMMHQMTHGKVLPTAVVEQIVAKTDGVPLFVEELTKMVLESGLLQEREEHYELTGPLPSLAIPVTLHDALLARLDRLAAAKGLAQLGATLGRTFAYALVRAVTPLEEVALHQSLRQLMEAEILYQQGMPPQATYQFKHALIQEAAYQSLLKSTRQQYHQHIAQVLEAQFGETVETQPEVLAHHYTAAALNAQAIPYWQTAGQRALQRSAHLEAISHFTHGLELLATLPDTPQRAQQELTLRLALGTSLIATRGYSAPLVEHTYGRALALCQHIGETPQLFPALGGLFIFYVNRGALRTAQQLSARGLQLAQGAQDPIFLPASYTAQGLVAYYLGDFAAAHGHFTHALSLYALAPHRSRAIFYQDPQAACLTYAALTLWSLGYPAQALASIHEALATAQHLAHPYTLVWTLDIAARLHQHRQEVRLTQERAEATMAGAVEYGFPLTRAHAALLQGWALAAQGRHEEGLTQMQHGLDASQTTGARIPLSYWLGLLAEGYGYAGRPAEGLAVLEEALAVVDDTEQRFYVAELYRLQGEFHLRDATPNEHQAEACLRQALGIARQQQAKSFELRAAMSLARLWQHQGKGTEARQLLAPVYDWFTEGLDTADLQEAQVLLDGLP